MYPFHATSICTIKPLSRKFKCRCNSTYVFRLFVEAEFNELFKLFAVVACQLRWVVLWNEEQNSHRMHFRVGRLTLGKFDGRDSQTPYVCLQLKKRKKLSKITRMHVYSLTATFQLNLGEPGDPSHSGAVTNVKMSNGDRGNSHSQHRNVPHSIKL